MSSAFHFAVVVTIVLKTYVQNNVNKDDWNN